MTDSTLDQINNLNADELVKDLLRNWYHIRSTYPDQIQRFYFNEQDKEELGQLAQKFYQKYGNQQSSTVVWDEGIFKEFFSVRLYGHETYPLFAYPYHILNVESLNQNIFDKILQECAISYMDLNLFAQIFWHEKWITTARFTQVDLQLLKAFFNHVKPRSRIGFPNTKEFWRSTMKFSERTARHRYGRFLNLGILLRRSLLNYPKLGLIPLLKICESENLSELESVFTIWKNRISEDKIIYLLVIPAFSSFWAEHSATDVNILQFRSGGVNIDLFDGMEWNEAEFSRLIDNALNVEASPVSQWNMDFTSVERFKFLNLDLKILEELRSTPERQIYHWSSRINASQTYIGDRLQALRDAGVFQTSFRLHHAGLNDRFYLLAIGSEEYLVPIHQSVCQVPQYYIMKAKNCFYAVMEFSSNTKFVFLKICERLGSQLDLEKFHYGNIDQTAQAHNPDLSNLWDEEKQIWYSEKE
ncbi:MAG: hypothetical protein ACFFC7_28570 [Candidatus Hermodarchaeota archaeon]